jgi:DNA-binding MarR family transcriptional regulator
MTQGEDVPARLALAIARMTRRLRSVDGGLSHGLLSALSTISKRGPIRLAELAQIETVSAPNITRLVGELESQGLVSRAVDPADGRAFLIEATPAGVETILEARSARTELLASLLAGLDARDRAALIAALPALEALTEESHVTIG